MKYILMFGTLIAGAMLPVQNILNTRLGKQTGGPLMGVLISFIIGTMLLIMINVGTNAGAIASIKPAKIFPRFIWLGGVLGAAFLAYTTWVSGHQNLALTFVLIVCGQILMALLIDNYGWLGKEIRPITTSQFIGVILILAGIYIIKK